MGITHSEDNSNFKKCVEHGFTISGEAPTEHLGQQIGMDLNPLGPDLIDTMIGDDEEEEDGTSERLPFSPDFQQQRNIDVAR